MAHHVNTRHPGAYRQPIAGRAILHQVEYPREAGGDVNWRTFGRCGTDPEPFHPEGSHAAKQRAEAKAVCRACPVIDRCLAWALDTNQREGVWGGLSETERRDLLNRRAAHPAGASAHGTAGAR